MLSLAGSFCPTVVYFFFLFRLLLLIVLEAFLYLVLKVIVQITFGVGSGMLAIIFVATVRLVHRDISLVNLFVAVWVVVMVLW